MTMLTEADTCRQNVRPKLHRAGWDHERISEQKRLTDGRTAVGGGAAHRRKRLIR